MRSSSPEPFPGHAGEPVDPSVDVEFRTICGRPITSRCSGRRPSRTPARGTFDPSAGQGTLSQQFQPTPPPTNDAFADAATLGQAARRCRRTGGPASAPSRANRRTVASRRALDLVPDERPIRRAAVDSPGNRVAVYQGTGLRFVDAVADGSSGKASFLTPGGSYLIAVEGGAARRRPRAHAR